MRGIKELDTPIVLCDDGCPPDGKVAAIESVGLTATPCHAHVPSFGEWGFVVASRRPYGLPTSLPAGLNRLSNQVLVTTYEMEWGRVAH